MPEPITSEEITVFICEDATLAKFLLQFFFDKKRLSYGVILNRSHRARIVAGLEKIQDSGAA